MANLLYFCDSFNSFIVFFFKDVINFLVYIFSNVCNTQTFKSIFL